MSASNRQKQGLGALLWYALASLALWLVAKAQAQTVLTPLLPNCENATGIFTNPCSLTVHGVDTVGNNITILGYLFCWTEVYNTEYGALGGQVILQYNGQGPWLRAWGTAIPDGDGYRFAPPSATNLSRHLSFW